MKTIARNVELVSIYVDMLQQPISKRFNMKALILDTVPAKRMLYQVYLSVKGFDMHQAPEVLATLPISEIRFISFLEGTLFTEAEFGRIMQALDDMRDSIPEQYRWHAPHTSKAFAFYGRKFGLHNINQKELDNLYSG